MFCPVPWYCRWLPILRFVWEPLSEQRALHCLGDSISEAIDCSRSSDACSPPREHHRRRVDLRVLWIDGTDGPFFRIGRIPPRYPSDPLATPLRMRCEVESVTAHNHPALFRW